MDQGDETCHLISLLARAEFIHPDDLEVTLGCYVNWSVNRELKQVVSMTHVWKRSQRQVGLNMKHINVLPMAQSQIDVR